MSAFAFIRRSNFLSATEPPPTTKHGNLLSCKKKGKYFMKLTLKYLLSYTTPLLYLKSCSTIFPSSNIIPKLLQNPSSLHLLLAQTIQYIIQDSFLYILPQNT